MINGPEGRKLSERHVEEWQQLGLSSATVLPGLKTGFYGKSDITELPWETYVFSPLFLFLFHFFKYKQYFFKTTFFLLLLFFDLSLPSLISVFLCFSDLFWLFGYSHCMRQNSYRERVQGTKRWDWALEWQKPGFKSWLYHLLCDLGKISLNLFPHL